MKSLEVPAPLFPKKYEPIGWEVAGKPLSPLAEEMLCKAARFIGTDYEEGAFHPEGNLWACLKPELSEYHRQLGIDDAGFYSVLVVMKELQRQAKESKTKERKAAEKAEREALRENHGFAILDGKRVPLMGYVIEEPNWIITRGEDPRKFLWKYEVTPDMVYLNVVNANPPEGWEGNTKSDPRGIWAIRYFQHCGRPEMRNYAKLKKAIPLSRESSVQQRNIAAKFDKSRDILSNWDMIQREIMEGCRKGSHAALISYLIQETGIRIGNERDKSTQALTYGMSTLLSEHIKIGSESTVSFDFLGKDSVRENRTISIDKNVHKTLSKIAAKRKKGQKFFGASSSDVNAFLKRIMPGITVKNIRTVVCNKVLVENLKNKTVKAADSESAKIRAMFEANLEIAKQLNHQKNVGKAQKNGESLAKEKVGKAKARKNEVRDRIEGGLAKLNEEAKKARLLHKGTRLLKEKLVEIEAKKAKLKGRLAKAESALDNAKLAADRKKMAADVNLGTSLANYCDFKVIKSWCDEFNLPIGKIFSNAQMKFVAPLVEGTPESYWRDYPNV